MLRMASVVMRRLRPAVWSLGFAALSSGGCIVPDGDKACGEDQVVAKGESYTFCVCAPGFVVDDETGTGCLPCGKNQETVQGECVCEEGYARPSESDECTKSDLGSACSDDSECAGDVPICAEGACTSDCASSDDCERGWLCDELDVGSVCVAAPDGYGMSCESTADCAETEATFCDTFQSKTCIVECSETSPCPGDWSCCDIAIASLVICVEPSGLTDGACPAGGELVNP